MRSAVTLTGVYFLSPNWSFEVLAASPFKHDVSLGVSGEGYQPRLARCQAVAADVYVPVSLHAGIDVRPYVGLGLNYTTFFNEELVPELSDQGISLTVDDSFGAAVQVAADIALSDKWLLNFDVRYISS